MSIKVMSEVWEHSKAKGSAHHLLLAIADNANEQGIAWPSVRTLARKARLSERQIQRLIRSLQRTGELDIHEGGGPPGSTHTYRVTICHPSKETGDISVTGGVTFEQGGVTPVSETGDMGVTRTVIEPSLGTVIEPNNDISWIERRYRRGKKRQGGD